jgi:hypothetical protein
MKLQVDLRDLNGPEFMKMARGLPSGVYIMMTAWQWSVWRKEGGAASLAERATVMAPDFLHYARLAGTGQPKEILKLPGSVGKVAAAAMACAPAGVGLLPGLAAGEFWAAAKAMVRYDLALLGGGFAGEVVLHYNLTDFACFFDRADVFRFFARNARGMRAWGFATQQLPGVLSMCARAGLVPDRLVFPTGMSRPETVLLEAARERELGGVRTTVDFTQWPSELLGAADLYDFSRAGDDTWLVSARAAVELG